MIRNSYMVEDADDMEALVAYYFFALFKKNTTSKPSPEKAVHLFGFSGITWLQTGGMLHR